MLLSNYTFSVELSHFLLYQRFLQQEGKDFIIQTGLVKEVKLFNLLTESAHSGRTLSLQLFFEDTEMYMSFELNHQHAFLVLMEKQVGPNLAFFQSLLEEI